MRLRSDISLRRSGGALRVFDPRQGGVYAFNGAGALLVEALAKGASRDALARVLVEQFEVTPLVARGDVAAFLEQLEQRGLVAS